VYRLLHEYNAGSISLPMKVSEIDADFLTFAALTTFTAHQA